MIRFSCPHCSRAYVLADALAHLPLVCKGCGQRLSVPDPSPEPEPPPPPKKPPALKLPPPAAPRPVAVKEAAPPPPEPPAEAITFIPTPSQPPVEVNSEGLFETPANADLYAESSEPPAPVKKPAVPPTKPARGRKLLSVVVDVLAVVILVALGAFAGELLVKKPSQQILTESSAAPKFPPVELLMWLAGPVLAGLIYLWLGTRGWTVGGWLKRRAAA